LYFSPTSKPHSHPPPNALSYEGRLSVLSANYDPQSSPEAKQNLSGIPPPNAPYSPSGKNGGGHHVLGGTMFPFSHLSPASLTTSRHTTAGAAAGNGSASKPGSRLDELFNSKSRALSLSVSVAAAAAAVAGKGGNGNGSLGSEKDDDDDQEIKVEDDDDDEEMRKVDNDEDSRPGESSSLDRLREICNKSLISLPPGTPGSGILDRSIGSDTDNGSSNGNTVYTCHLCSFSSLNRDEFNNHVNGHYEFRCCKCEFMTKEEEDYRVHLKAEHDITPEELEDEQGVRVPKINSQGKMKTFKCKQCEFFTVTKEDFWQHTRSHIKPEKMLTCPKCSFVTEYKHHLEYHLRNHFGSKPFKCPSCSYTCVNKSMLNSHMKSHTNVYQYRCQDCTYATKYCHSLKLHLRKYGHKPAMVLNPDGTPNPLPIIDIYGTRRGPKMKKDEASSKMVMSSNRNESSPASITPSMPSAIPDMATSPVSAAAAASASSVGGAFPTMLPSYVMAQMQHIHRMATGVRSPPSHFPLLPTIPDDSAVRAVREGDKMLQCRICHFETINAEVCNKSRFAFQIMPLVKVGKGLA
jgi:hypothetical protein